MNYRTLADMARLIRANIHSIPRVDCVVGIPRSGMIAASMIATLTNQKLLSVSQLGSCQYKSILLVDDSVADGATMCEMFHRVRAWHPEANITTLAVFVKPNSPLPEMYFETVPGPRVFEWNWHRSKYLGVAILDIDGVISTETLPGHREKGVLLYRPARNPLALATGRREYEREETTRWLRRHDIEYGRLFMTDVPAYVQGGKMARATKVKACEIAKPRWFVESNIHQAEYIRANTGLPVLCVDSNVML